MHFVGAMSGWAVGEDGYFLKTIDGGANWTSKSLNFSTNFFDVHFVDAQVGWAVGDYGYILKTTTGGDPLSLP